GGDAGSVAVTLARADAPYDITTSGDLIIGVLAVSRGGEGGDGADNTAVAGRSGGGGFGGDGGDVSVTAQSDIRIATHGNYASGMMAMSLGGGGGTGGDFVNILGGGAGNGGNGGDAGNVTVNNGADITTTGLYSFGIAAQSISGGGGSGGIAAGLVLEVGGDGQAGGTPGDVEVSNFGAISTDGYGSHGILAHSVADGGGAAGGSGGIFAIGGNASSAHESTGGSVSLANAGTVATRGDAAKGILAQSIGGGGGSGAGTAGVLSVGGQGQAGGDGGQVIVSSLGTVNTWGEFAHGVQAHSIGGGGGDGGSAFDLALGAGIGVGGVGAGGGDGGAVTVSGSETANIPTWGYGSIGLLAQSVGKGGGSGGTAFGAGVANLTFQIGGDGGGAGSGGAVQVDRSNMQIATAGGLAAGLQAQSIGGGGGTGGGVITDVAGAEIALNMSVGGSGGVAGDGGQVDVKLGQTHITTTGSVDQTAESEDADGSSAILAQSIGGGGGNGGNSIIDSFILGIPIEGVGVSVPITLAVGGTGGSGGDGVAVRVDLDQSELRTFAHYSRGILAQSVGGGGGNGGDSSVYSLAVDFPTTFNLQLQAAVGGQCDATACAGGDGGAVDVDLRQSLISTGGDYATGVLAQSLGGGGGSGGAAYSSHYALGTEASVALTVSVGGKGAVGGNGGAVDVGQDADSYIVTSGSGARGIVAQSVGGGGGESQGVAAAATLGGTLIPGVDPLPRLDMVVQVGREGAGGGDGAAAGVR